MKRFIYTIMALGLLFSCHSPEEIHPTTDKLGINSVSASYVDGALADDPNAVFTATVTNLAEDIVIVFPWFYPEDTDNQLTDITKMKVTASIDYNCFLDPKIVLLDLTQPNYFEFTDGRGVKQQICIRGEIRKLWKSSLVSFSITDPELTTLIDDAEKTVTVTINDLSDISNCKVDYVLSPHATCSLDGMTSVNFHDVDNIKVTAQDGTSTEYKIILSKEIIPKVPYGFRKGSESRLWSLDLVSLGIPHESGVNPSLAVIGSKVVICPGNGDTPFYVNKANGVKEGNIVLGPVEANGYIRNDDGGHLLIANRTDSDFKIWTTSSVDEAPVELLSYTITDGFPIGGKLSVQGDIQGDALIVAPLEGVAGVTGSNQMIIWEIRGGAVADPKLITLSGFVGQGSSPGYWGSAPENVPGIVPFSEKVEDGFLFGVYDEDVIYHIDGTTFAMTSKLGAQSDGSGWMWNNNSMDTKMFNKAKYTALLCSNFFPQWGGIPSLYIYDSSNMATFTGTVDACGSVALTPECSTFFVDGSGPTGAGDVILVPSKDGYYMNLFYIEHNNRIIEAFQCDCIDK